MIAAVPEIPANLPGELWGIATCFNPAGYRNKYDHLQQFSASVRQDGLKLLLIELCLRGAESVLRDDVADLVIRLHSETILWHKERLFNIALAALPDSCDKVAWLDTDLLWENRDWVHETAQLLNRYVVIQPFQFACWLPKGVQEIPSDDDLNTIGIEVLPASAYSQLTSSDPSAIMGHPGFAWVARRSLLARHGFYDRCILGGGDWAMTWAMFRNEDIWPGRGWSNALHSPALERDLRAWSSGFNRDVQGSVYFTPGRVFHLWHGEKKNRRYLLRSVILRDANFDPALDVALDESHCWCWKSNKPDLHRRVEEYFYSRKEEG